MFGGIAQDEPGTQTEGFVVKDKVQTNSKGGSRRRRRKQKGGADVVQTKVDENKISHDMVAGGRRRRRSKKSRKSRKSRKVKVSKRRVRRSRRTRRH